MQTSPLISNRLVHFDSFEVYFWKRIAKNFLLFSWIGVLLTVIYISFDYQLHGNSSDLYYILGGRLITLFFAIMVVIATAHSYFKNNNVIAITTFGTMGFSAVTLTYLLFGNPPYFVVYSWFFYLIATIMLTPLITKKIFFIMESYQIAFIFLTMVLTKQKNEDIAIFISLALPLMGYVYAAIWVGRKNGIEAYNNARQNHFLMSIDGLSNLLNRRTWYEISNRQWNADKKISFIMLDIDYFKKINDTYGHDCGDKVIAYMAQIFLEETREYDIIGRLGGEEFGIILPQTSLEDAYMIAERIRQKIERTIITYNEYSLNITISIGVIHNNETIENLNQLILLGDQCLYEAKAKGRNCVIQYLKKD